MVGIVEAGSRRECGSSLKKRKHEIQKQVRTPEHKDKDIRKRSIKHIVVTRISAALEEIEGGKLKNSISATALI